MGVLRRMGRQGDVPTRWEVDDEGQVVEAAKRFNDALKHGMLAFDLTTEPGEQIKVFKPAAKEIVLIPQIAGG